MINSEQIKDQLIISYIKEDGSIGYHKIQIPESEFYKWVYCSKKDPDRSTTMLSHDEKAIKKIKTKYLTQHRLTELVQRLPDNIKSSIFKFNKVDKWFMDIETSMTHGLKINELMENPIEQILTNTFFSQKSGIATSTGLIKLSGLQIERIQSRIDEHFKKLGRSFKWEYRYYNSEELMILDLLRNDIPRMPFISGWNFKPFDWAYIIARAEKLKLDISVVSPTGKMKNSLLKRKFAKKGEGVKTKFPLHRLITDYQAMYEKFDTSVAIKESSKLDWVANELFGVKKVEYSGTLTELYQNDFETYIFYNAVDAIIVSLIDEKINSFDSLRSIAFVANTEIDNGLYASKTIEALLVKKLYAKNMVIVTDYDESYKDEVDEVEYDFFKGDDESYAGGYVKEPMPGKFKYVCGWDFQSLFPSIKMMTNSGLDTYLGMREENSDTYISHKDGIRYKIDDTMVNSVSGAIFTKEKSSVMREIIFDLFFGRVEAGKNADEIEVDIKNMKELLEKKKNKII